MEKMMQADLYKGIAEEAGCHPNNVKLVMDAAKNQIKAAVSKGLKVGIQGMGTWYPYNVPAKTRTHHFGKRKGEEYTTVPKTVIKHKVSLGRPDAEEDSEI